MHMADALISPAVGGTLWAASAGILAWSARRIKQSLSGHLVPMMGVLGAFIFAAQMINFTIPGTGSSGHLGGGLILAALLGPHAAFLVMASVLTVQALFFADGGLLALGCNIFNLGFLPAFIAYPLVYRPLARSNHTSPRAWTAAIIAAIAALQLGAFSVVLQTTASGISELPFGGFILLMSPIHLAIGIVEGLATAAVVSFVARTRPEALPEANPGEDTQSLRPILAGFLLGALLLGAALSWFASSHPDGLEWAIAKTSGQEELPVEEDAKLHRELEELQQKTVLLPDYGFKATGETEEAETTWPTVDTGTSLSGLIGGLLTLLLASALGFLFKPRRLPSA